ncbi:hypothetical protein RHECNPAF_930020 [Rhizobium etli CNPAF512]|nr:hypothetical protein RHECNPAF_930020 [Rhizobium etli CNPAF512]
MAAGLERRRNDIVAGSRNDDVEDQIGFCCRDDLGEIRADDGAVEAELGSELFGRLAIEVDEADDGDGLGEIRVGCDGPQPTFGHSSAPAQNGTEFHDFLQGILSTLLVTCTP